MTAPPAAKRRNAGALIAVGAVFLVGALAALALAALIVGGSRDKPSATNYVPADPGNFRGSGTAALAETLTSRGVSVNVARNQQQLQAWSNATSSTVVVISRATGASKSSTRIVRDKARSARRIVILDPRAEVLAQWGIDAALFPGSGTQLDSTAQCSAAGIAPTDRAEFASMTIRPAPEMAATLCFASSTEPGAAAVVVFPATASRPEIVLAQQDWFRNAAILEKDHAGIAVRMIGAGKDVHWFSPDYSDLRNDDPAQQQATPKLEPDVPQWLWPMIGLSPFVLLALMFWRGRRFGQLITEPLPAVVKAAETTEARGRLYYASADAHRAAAQLRNHALRTIPRRLGVSRHAPIDDVVAAVARATGRDQTTVFALLAGPLPVDNAALVAFATDLSTLEEEVRPVL